MTPTHRPTVVAAVLSVAAGIVAVAIVGDAPAQRQALTIEVAGLSLLAIGYATWRRRLRTVGVLLAIGGVSVAVFGLLIGASEPARITQTLELLPGMVGLLVLVGGLLPIRSGWERRLVAVGTGLVFLTVVTSGVVRGTPTTLLLVAAIATVLSWDAAEQSISLGRQMGREATTYRSELVHTGSSAFAGVVVIVLAIGVQALDVQGLSLSGLVALLMAAVALSVWIYY